MKIYTRTGDDGTTGLFGGERAKKSDLRVEAYGTVDEANAAIGSARASGVPPALDALLAEIQGDLFTLGAELACAPGKENKLTMKLIGTDDAERLERAIDAAEVGLPELRVFVLPGGSPAAAALHIARCVVRRAERALVNAAEGTPTRAELLVYLNRLSDLLFTLARRANHLAGVADVPWHGLGTKKDKS
jgi:cob(I)alamin adenosyltransferase